jgi:hypothetical protein
MKSCHQKLGESLWEYICRFRRKCHELPKVGDTDVISTFWSGTTYQTFVHKLSYDQLKTTNELLDIATYHTFGEEAVEAVFVQGDGKMVLSTGRGGGHRPKPMAKVLRKAPKTVERNRSGTPNRS